MFLTTFAEPYSAHLGQTYHDLWFILYATEFGRRNRQPVKRWWKSNSFFRGVCTLNFGWFRKLVLVVGFRYWQVFVRVEDARSEIVSLQAVDRLVKWAVEDGGDNYAVFFLYFPNREYSVRRIVRYSDDNFSPKPRYHPTKFPPTVATVTVQPYVYSYWYLPHSCTVPEPENRDHHYRSSQCKGPDTVRRTEHFWSLFFSESSDWRS